MKRREFITVLGGVATWPIAARTEQARKIARIGYLAPAVPATGVQRGIEQAFKETLQQLGWVEGRNLTIEKRYSAGRQDAVVPTVEEIVRLGVDVIVAWGPHLSVAVKQAAPQIPLVFLLVFDPVDLGLVSNIPHPGGNVTGITSLASREIFAKRLQLLKEVLPSLSRVAVLTSTERTRSARDKDELEVAARTLDIQLEDVQVDAPSALEEAMNRVKERGAQALYVWPSGFTYSFPKQISEAARTNNLPSMHSFRNGALNGGLLAYAADLKDEVRRGAVYADKILRGSPPGDLPVEQMSKYEPLINLKTAKALGLEVPRTLLAGADEVIE